MNEVQNDVFFLLQKIIRGERKNIFIYVHIIIIWIFIFVAYIFNKLSSQSHFASVSRAKSSNNFWVARELFANARLLWADYSHKIPIFIFKPVSRSTMARILYYFFFLLIPSTQSFVVKRDKLCAWHIQRFLFSFFLACFSFSCWKWRTGFFGLSLELFLAFWFSRGSSKQRSFFIAFENKNIYKIRRKS